MSKSNEPLDNTEKIALVVLIFEIVKWLTDLILRIIFNV